jgi:hypothetical protein
VVQIFVIVQVEDICQNVFCTSFQDSRTPMRIVEMTGKDVLHQCTWGPTSRLLDIWKLSIGTLHSRVIPRDLAHSIPIPLSNFWNRHQFFVRLVMKKLHCRCRTRSLPITISLILCFCWDRPLFVDHAPIPFCISTNFLFYGSQLLFCWFNFIFFLIKLQFVWVESLVSAVNFQTFIFLDMYPNVWWSNMVKSQMAA